MFFLGANRNTHVRFAKRFGNEKKATCQGFCLFLSRCCDQLYGRFMAEKWENGRVIPHLAGFDGVLF